MPSFRHLGKVVTRAMIPMVFIFILVIIPGYLYLRNVIIQDNCCFLRT